MVIRRCILFLIVCTFFFKAPSHVSACDIINGSDIYFKHVSKKKYIVTYVLYHQCACALSILPKFTIQHDNGTISHTPPRISIRDITPICSTGQPPCNQPGGSRLGIEEHIFVDTIDFNSPKYSAIGKSCKIYFRVAQPWGLISTTTSTTTYGGMAMLNICRIDTVGNNSPTFSNIAMAFLCCNQPAYINSGALDNLDRDSLSFELAEPLDANFKPITWLSPWSKNYPLTPYCLNSTVNCTPIPTLESPIGFYFDTLNADIIFTPTNCNENGPLSIKVTEWRKDSVGKWQEIAYVRRDMYVTIVNCPGNNPPKVIAKFTHNVCAGSTIKIPIKSEDKPFVPPPPGVPKYDTVKLSWNNGIQGGKFYYTDTVKRERSAEFSWTPGDEHVSTLPYNFTVTAEDDNCPRKGISTRGFSIIVKPRPYSDRFYTILPCGKLVLHADINKSYTDSSDANFKFYHNKEHFNAPKISYSWTGFDSLKNGPLFRSINKTDTIKFDVGGKKIIELTLQSSNGCNTIYFDTIILPPILDIKLAVNDTFVCENDSLYFNPIIKNGHPAYKFQWGTPNINSDADTFPTFTLFPTTDTSVSVSILDSEGCTDTDTVFVHWQEISTPKIQEDQRICSYDSFTLISNYDSTLKYRWNDGLIGDDTILTIKVAGKYWLHTLDSLGCFGRDTFELFVNDTVIAQAGPDDVICRKEIYELRGGRENDPSFTHTWQWDDLRTNTIAGTTQNLEVSPTDSTNYRLYLRITEGGVTCEDDDTMYLRVNQLPDLSTVRDPSPKCFDDGQFDLGADFPTGANFRWSEKANSTVWYSMEDSRRDTMVRKGTATPNWYYTQRFFNPDMNQGYVPDPNIDRVKIHVRHNATGCEDSTTFNARINPNPTVITENITRCQDAGSFKVNDFVLIVPQNPDAGIYTWEIDSAPSTLTTPELGQILQDKNPSPFFADYEFNPMNPFFAVDHPENVKRLGTYKLKFCYTDGLTNCRTCDSAYITVEKLPEIQFTPFDKFCYDDDTVRLDDYVNLQRGRWELKAFNGQTSGAAYNAALSRMIDSTGIIVTDPTGAGGTYTWRYVNVMTGCPVKDSIDMIVSNKPPLRLDDLDTICLSSGNIDLINQIATPSTAVFNSGGPETGWSGPGVTANAFDPTAVVTPNATQAIYGPYVFTVTYQNPNTLCTNKDSIDVSVQAAPDIVINNQLPFEACEGNTFTLDATAERASGGITWTTDGDGGFDDNSSLSAVYTPGTDDIANYGNILTITSNQPDSLQYCPQATANIKIDVHAYPVFEFGTVDSGCTPVTADFSVFNITRPDLNQFSVRYDWDFGNGQNSTDSAPQGIVFTDEGAYNVRVTVTNNSGNCATTEEDTLIRVFPIPVASFSSDPDYYTTVALPKFNFTSTSSISNGSIDSTIWDFDYYDIVYSFPNAESTETNPSFAYGEDTTEYTVQLIVISDNGCKDTASKVVKIGPDITVYIPSAFSPDGAGPNINNKFFVSAQGYINFNLKIFNRWGEKLFESNHPESEPWDGTYQGEPVQQDVYMYYARVIGFDGEEYEYSGTVTLIR